jgi:hypothetical protein
MAPGKIVSPPPPSRIGIGNVVLASVSSGSGSVPIDGLLGAGIGYFIAPRGEKLEYAVGGGLVGGLAGVLGIAAILAFRYIRSR